MFDLDGNIAGTTITVQANTFQDCYFSSNVANCKYGLQLVRQGGGNAQGSENLFLNCHFFGFTQAGFSSHGANALSNTIFGGNFQNCSKYAIYIEYGSVNVYSVGFQNGTTTQIDNDGFDIAIFNSANDTSTIKACRSESACFLRSGAFHRIAVDDCNIVWYPAQWTPSHAYAAGDILIGTNTNGDGKLYFCSIAGTSGGTEPTWAGGGKFSQLPGTSISVGSNQLFADPSESLFAGVAVGSSVRVPKAGASNSTLVATITAKTSNDQVTLSVSASASMTGERIFVAPSVTSGTATFGQIEFNQFRSTNLSMRGCSISHGRVSVTQFTYTPITIEDNIFGRADAIDAIGLFSADTFSRIDNNLVRINGGADTGANPSAYTLFSLNGSGGGQYSAKSFHDVANKAVIMSGGVGTIPFGDVGIVRGNTSTTVPADNTMQVIGGLQLQSRTFANIGTPPDGTIVYCSDGTPGAPLTGGGSGSIAIRRAGIWVGL